MIATLPRLLYPRSIESISLLVTTNALLGNQSSSEWNIGPAENFHRVRRGDFRTVRDHPPLVKFAFAEQSVCDRIAFARSESSNRTARRPSGEKRRTACLLAQAGHFLRVRFQREIRRIAGISAYFQRNAAGFLCS